MVGAAHTALRQLPPLSIHPPRQPHKQRETRGQASFGPLGTGCPRAGGTGPGITTLTVPKGKERALGQHRASPQPQATAWGCCAAPVAQTRTLKTPKKADPLRRYLLKRCSLGAPRFKLEDRLVGHLDGRAVLPSPPRRGARQTLKSPLVSSFPPHPNLPVTRVLSRNAALPGQTSYARPGTAPRYRAPVLHPIGWRCRS